MKRIIFGVIITLGLLMSKFDHLLAQSKLPVIRSGVKSIIIEDGKGVNFNWDLDPKDRPGIYYVNAPRANNTVRVITDQDKVNFKTEFGENYSLVVLLNGKDSCFIRISAKDDPAIRLAKSDRTSPDTIPFTLIGSRVHIPGRLNGEHPVTIQFDTGAGGTVVNKMVADKLGLRFDSKTVVTNSQGTNVARNSLGNTLNIGSMQWQNLPVTEVGNMDAGEDIIVGTYLFRDKVIDLDYDRKLMIISDKLPKKAKSYSAQPYKYHGGGNFKATIRHNNQSFTYWFGFDTGRDGTMRIGQDFTRQNDNWNKLQPLMILPDGRKIIRLDATIAGVEFKDIVTNAADPNNPARRGTLFGSEILNHFNIILDNRKGMLYLKPNNRVNEPYSNYSNYLDEVPKKQ